MRFYTLLTTFTLAAPVCASAATFCPDPCFRTQDVPCKVNPWVAQIGDRFGNFFCPYDGSYGQFLVIGGSGNYSTSSYPQFVLYDLFEAVLADPADFGTAADLSVNSEDFKNYFWGVYGGYHCGLDQDWDIGLEIGYKKLLRTKTTTNIVRDTIGAGDPTPITPFRLTSTYVWDLMVTARYFAYSGFNLFIKAGGAKVNTNITEGNFIADMESGTFNGKNAFGTQSYNLCNIYPEVEIGAGFRFLNHFEIHVSYAKIFGETENDLVSTTAIFFRPRKCPSLDIFAITLEMMLF